MVEGGKDFVAPLEHFEQQVKRIKYEEEEDHGGIELDEINIELEKPQIVVPVTTGKSSR